MIPTVCCWPTHSTANVALRASLLKEVSREQASDRVDAARHSGPRASAKECKAAIGASDVLASHAQGQSDSRGVVLLGSLPLSSEKSSSNAASGATTPLRASSTFCSLSMALFVPSSMTTAAARQASAACMASLRPLRTSLQALVSWGAIVVPLANEAEVALGTVALGVAGLGTDGALSANCAVYASRGATDSTTLEGSFSKVAPLPARTVVSNGRQSRAGGGHRSRVWARRRGASNGFAPWVRGGARRNAS